MGWPYGTPVYACKTGILTAKTAPIIRVRRRPRRTFSTHFDIFQRRFDGFEIYVVFLLFNVYVGFSSSQVIGTRAAA